MEEKEMMIGVDPARGGDKTVYVVCGDGKYTVIDENHFKKAAAIDYVRHRCLESCPAHRSAPK